jgi:protease-4
MSSDSETTGSDAWKYVVVAVVAVLIGAVLAPYAANVSRNLTSETSPAVAVITIEGPITGATVDAVREDLREARQNGSIRAVVLKVDSPGGAVTASESLYLAVNRTAAQMPVVAHVTGLGASGAYYGMMPADRIYVTPGSIVGSVGVIATAPQGGISGAQIVTGPDKGSGRTADEARAQVETLRRAFIETVYQHRGDDLQIEREQLSYAKVYTGASAVQNGVADNIGGLQTAIAHAGEEAGLESYRIVRKEPPQTGIGIILAESEDGNRTVVVQEDTFGYEGVDTVQYLALWGHPEGQEVITDGND